MEWVQPANSSASDRLLMQLQQAEQAEPGALLRLPGCRHTQELTFTPFQVAFRVYVLPLTCCLGLLANITNAYVFSHKKVGGIFLKFTWVGCCTA